MRHQSRIAYELSKNSEIAIKIYNASGQLVRVAENGVRTAGRHSANWDGRDDLGRQVSAGVYFYRLSVPGFTGTGRLTVVR
jgi:flagellar hook assembly protein FlgD